MTNQFNSAVDPIKVSSRYPGYCNTNDNKPNAACEEDENPQQLAGITAIK